MTTYDGELLLNGPPDILLAMPYSFALGSM